MTYDEWEARVPAAIKGDSLWKVEVYRLARFLGDLAWPDVTKLMKDERTRHLAAQLYDSVGGIGGTFSEGFSRSTGKERARFYEYALGSARETRDWYYMARFVLGEKVAMHRIDLATQIIRLLLTMIPNQRRYKVRLTEA